MKHSLRTAFGFLLVAALALAVPPAFRHFARSKPANPKVVYSVGVGPLLWSPASPSFPPAVDGQRLNPEGRPLGTVEGWEGLLLGNPLDLNQASAVDLEALPGVGPKLAASLLETRNRLDGFHAVEDLLQVRGIGPKTLERLGPWMHASRR